MSWYVDTSALVKLVVLEPETPALLAWLGAREQPPVCSDLARTELLRAVRRAAPTQAGRAREVLDAVTLVQVTSALCEAAGRLDPPPLPSVEAIHLATALDLGDDCEGLVTYDGGLAAAARAYGLAVVAP